MRGTPRVETAVIGAGPYGLSVAAHLSALGREVRIFGRPMGTWLDRMPDGMILKSEGFATSLSDPPRRYALPEYAARHGMPYQDTGLPIPLADFRAYGLWFQRNAVPAVEQTEVVSLARQDGHFTVGLATGETVPARTVVLAVGTTYFAYVPPVLTPLRGEHVSHTSEHRVLSGFRGHEVTVVGAGQSALETATLLHEHGAGVRVLVRGGSLAWNPDPRPQARSRVERLRCPTAELCGCGWQCLFYSHGAGLFHHLPLATRLHVVGSTFGPAGAWWLKPRLEGRFEVRLGCRVTGARPAGDRVVLEVEDDAGVRQELATDHVIAGTGYRVDVAAIPFLDRSLVARIRQRRGLPVLSRTFESSVPGLHVVGLAAAHEFGPAMRFVYGADFTARRLTGGNGGYRAARSQRRFPVRPGAATGTARAGAAGSGPRQGR
jgi:thioredoxin reductase